MNYIYGELSKEVTPVSYHGKETNTATVTVDNDKREISVDVKSLSSILSEIEQLKQRVSKLEVENLVLGG